MGSSYRHWPSLFKSKPCTSCNTPDDHQWQHGMPIMPSSCSCHKPPLSSNSGEERNTPEAKPRWNPKPEQVRILETIFNSGMINPPRDEIRRICAQLQGFGHVADANVFYWFQNRKSRSKHKQRHLHSRSRSTTTTAATTTSEPKSLFQTPGVRYCEPPLVSTTAIAGTPAEPSSMLWSALFEQREGFKGVAPAPAIALTSTTTAAAVNEIQGGDSKVFFGAGRFRIRLGLG